MSFSSENFAVALASLANVNKPQRTAPPPLQNFDLNPIMPSTSSTIEANITVPAQQSKLQFAQALKSSISQLEKTLLYGAACPNPGPLANGSCSHFYVPIDSSISVSSSSYLTANAQGSQSSSGSNFSVGNGKMGLNYDRNHQDFMKTANTTMNSNNAAGSKKLIYCLYCTAVKCLQLDD